MNCIFLLLLLGCCGGWGNSCGTPACGNGNACGNDRPRPCRDRRDCDRRGPECPDFGRRQDGCRCEEKRPCREADGCGCARDERDGCDAPGMIPPPWQEYPKFPHRDGDGCEA